MLGVTTADISLCSGKLLDKESIIAYLEKQKKEKKKKKRKEKPPDLLMCSIEACCPLRRLVRCLRGEGLPRRFA